MHVIYDTESLIVHGIHDVADADSWQWPATVYDVAGHSVLAGPNETTAIRIFEGEAPVGMSGGQYKLVEADSDELIAA